MGWIAARQRSPLMVIGVDFDNTIVCYDALFHRVAVERGLVPAGTPARKADVRDCLRRGGREEAWTELQGHVYGPGMAEAPAFPGVMEFFARAIRTGLSLYIISHKTRHPAVGPAHDLHQAARDWLVRQGFFDRSKVGLPPDRVLFGGTRQEKIELVQQAGCTHFIDDLEETFLEESFPRTVKRILFAPQAPSSTIPDLELMSDWRQIQNYVFAAAN
jgi:hypothetical protein